jgi:hypothetical protein
MLLNRCQLYVIQLCIFNSPKVQFSPSWFNLKKLWHLPAEKLCLYDKNLKMTDIIWIISYFLIGSRCNKYSYVFTAAYKYNYVSMPTTQVLVREPRLLAPQSLVFWMI